MRIVPLLAAVKAADQFRAESITLWELVALINGSIACSILVAFDRN